MAMRGLKLARGHATCARRLLEFLKRGTHVNSYLNYMLSFRAISFLVCGVIQICELSILV